LSVDGAGNASFSGELSAATGTFGDDSTDQFISYDGTTLTLGSGVTIGDNTDRTVTVGSGGDFSTINLALEALSKTVPAYKSGGFEATIEIKTGTVVVESTIVSGVNLSWITIQPESFGESLSVDFDSIASSAQTSPYLTFMAAVDGGVGPVMDIDIVCTNGTISDEHVIYYANGTGSRLNTRPITMTGTCQTAIILSEGSELYGVRGDGLLEISTTCSSAVFLSGNSRLISERGLTFDGTSSNKSIAIISGSQLSCVGNITSNGVIRLTSGSFLSAVTTITCTDLEVVSGSSSNSATVDASGQIYIFGGSIVRRSTGTGSANITGNTFTSDGIFWDGTV
jgi:hypothetical protein